MHHTQFLECDINTRQLIMVVYMILNNGCIKPAQMLRTNYSKSGFMELFKRDDNDIEISAL